MNISIRSQFAVVPPWLWLVELISVSIFQMTFFVLVVGISGNNDVGVEYVALGNALQSVTFVTVYSVCGIPGSEKHGGTLSSIMTTPSRLFTIFTGKALFQILAGIFTVAISLTFATQLFGVSLQHANLLAVGAIILVTTFSMTGFGLMLSSIGLYTRSSTILASLVMYVGLILCGVNFPVSELPAFLRPLSYLLPLTYGVEGLRKAVSGASVFDLGPILIIMIALGVLALLMANWMFHIFETMARKRGTLDMF